MSSGWDLNGFFAGMTSGMAKTLASYPIDTLKANIQASQTSASLSVNQIYGRNRLWSFYSGVQYPLMFSMVTSASFFTTFYGIRPYFGENYWWLAAPVAGSLSGLVHAPIERLKIRKQVAAKLPSSPFSGLRISAIRDFFGYGIYMNNYQLLHRHTDLFDHTYGKVLGPLIAGFPATIFIHPFDTIKTRIQCGAGSDIVPVLRQLYQEAGLSWMYRGLLVTLLKNTPRVIIEVSILNWFIGSKMGLGEE